ncbi:MAG TPA: acyltransferase [Falsiroseomonas sp.]|jgi:peptidoglycan/LPS O-acetylase OafA/YrhL|nr:acyltransferase [Falsiroseomonas sp.]
MSSAGQLPRIRSIEGLRGLLALWVLFSHVVTAAGLGEGWRGPFRVIHVGTHAVDAFIIVSGFVIAYLLDTAREGYGPFLKRRVLRLYPVYLICLLVSALLLPMQIRAYGAVPFSHPHNDYLVEIAHGSLDQLPAHIAAHLAMAHSLLPNSLLEHSNYAILSQGWSLSLEWQFYLLAPAVLWLLLRGTWPALCVIALACGAHFLLAGPQGFLPRHVPEFALGIACYLVWRMRRVPDLPLLLPAGIALAYLTTHNPAVVVWTTVFLATLQPAGFGAPIVNAVLTSAPLLALGRWSYSVYLSHTIVLLLMMEALRLAGTPALGQWPHFGVLLAATLAGTLLVAALLYRFVEAPCIALGRRQSRAALAGTRS